MIMMILNFDGCGPLVFNDGFPDFFFYFSQEILVGDAGAGFYLDGNLAAVAVHIFHIEYE